MITKIVADQKHMTVSGVIPVSSVKYVDEQTKCRNSQDGTQTPGSNNQLESEPTFSGNKVIPFQFTVKMPPPRYYPMILERDEKGRIVSSKFPEAIL